MADKIVQAKVTRPTYVNSVLHLPGEVATVNLDDLKVDALGEKTPGLEKLDVKDPSALIEQVQVAPVAPHAPFADAPQGIPPGSVISGTGRTLSPADEEAPELSREMVAPEPPAKKK